LKFLDALDAEKIIIPLLSPRGKVSLLYTRGQKGWQFGTFKIGKEEAKQGGLKKVEEAAVKSEAVSIERSADGGIVSRKAEFEPSIKSKILIITDTPSSLDRIRNVILPEIDKKPKQILIETRIMEVNRDKLKDIGIDWGTGVGGATGYNTPPSDLFVNAKNTKTLAGRNLASEFTPNYFSPLEGTTSFPGTYPYKAGLELLFKKLTGAKFEIILHALEEDANTNILSAPRVLTLDNQEAAILVGYHTPILSSTVAAPTVAGQSPTISQTLDYYQEIGIRLNVVPQVNEDGYINMLVHPSITSSTRSVKSINQVGGGSSVETEYPVVDVREAQTQVLLKDGETIVMGGLLKDVKGKETIGIPILNKIPFIGVIFQRQIDDIQKVDLLIFITARIVKEGDFTPAEIAKLERELGKDRTVKADFKSKKKTKKQKAQKKTPPPKDL
jgi:type II secretory pathway component GspD/PulD (secretin)